ncbi:hypothetical protein [Floridanema evergladense]
MTYKEAINHQDDRRRLMSDAEVLTTALVAALFFHGNQAHARVYLQESGLIPAMLDKSRFCRRLHALSELMYDLFHQIGMLLKATNSDVEYLLDSFPVAANDVRGLNALPLNLPPLSEIYADSAYTDYQAEDALLLIDEIGLKALRKKNSHRAAPPWISFYKQATRHRIETVFSEITRLFPKSIHAVTFSGFLIKITCFILAITFKKAFI